MKLDWNKKYTTISVYVFCTVAALILFLSAILYGNEIIVVTKSVLSILSPVIYGVIIAYLLAPLDRLINSLLRRIMAKHNRRSHKLCGVLSIIFTYIIFLTVITGFAFLVVPDIAKSLQDISSNMTNYYNAVVAYIRGLHIPFLEIPENALEFENLLSHAYNIIRGFFPQLYTFLQSLVTEIMNILIGVLISIYVLAGRIKAKNACKKGLRALFDDRKADGICDFFREADRTFGGFVSGKILDSVIIGILCFILMTVFRMPNAALISLLVGVTNVIPVFGPFIGAVPSALLVFLVEPQKTIWFVILIIALQQLDGNVIGPKILGDSTGLPAFWVIFSLLLFGGFFGVFGMLIAVPTFALLYNGIKRFVNSLLDKKKNTEEQTKTAAEQNET